MGRCNMIDRSHDAARDTSEIVQADCSGCAGSLSFGFFTFNNGRFMRVWMSLVRNLGIVLVVLGAGGLYAQIDTVYIRTSERTTIDMGKARQEFSFGLLRMTHRAREKVSVTTSGGSFDVELIAGKRLLLDLTVSPYRLFEIQRTSSGNAVSASELNKFFSAQNKKSTTLAFDYLEKYKNGIFTTDALLLINFLNSEEQLRSLADAMAKENYYLAADLALGLVNNPGIKHLSKDQLVQMNTLLTSVAGFLHNAGTLAINSGQYQKGIDLYKTSNQLAPRTDLPELIAKTERVYEDLRITKLIKEADSLEKVNALSETFRSLQRANEIRPDEEISQRLERLDIQMQDSLYQKAVVADKKEQFIFYRKKGYLTYLSRYPNGKYSENAGARVARLNKDQHRVNKVGAFYGWGAVGFQDDVIGGKTHASMNSIGIGRLTETRFLGLDFSFNQDFFEMRDLSTSGDIDLTSYIDKIILTNDFNNQKNYTGAFTASISYGMLFHKARSLRLFAGGTLGWGQLKTWVYGYKYSVITDKLPYSTAGKNAYYYKVDSENVNRDLPYFSILLLGEFKGLMFKGSVSIAQPLISNLSVGYSF
jgi:tetratricopeptide (TPR) repeat protein